MFLMLNPHLPPHAANIFVAAVGLSIRGQFYAADKSGNFKRPHCGCDNIVGVYCKSGKTICGANLI